MAGVHLPLQHQVALLPLPATPKCLIGFVVLANAVNKHCIADFFGSWQLSSFKYEGYKVHK
jgi:hypothetical protein